MTTNDAGSAPLHAQVRPQRWTARAVEASEHGGFVALGDYLELLRWKSTHAPRLEAMQGLLHAAQHEAHAGREAIATLDSERAANALLTDEVERLRVGLLDAIEEVESWAAYTSEYFRQKHSLDGTLARLRAHLGPNFNYQTPPVR